MKKTVSKKMKKVATPAKEFVAGQLALHDIWDDGRGNSTTTTRLVMIVIGFSAGRSVVMLENGETEMVSLNTLRPLPEVFNGATV